MKTQHQIFLDDLHKQLIPDARYQEDTSKDNNSEFNKGVYKKDITRELVDKFDALFGNLDDDD